ncbi:MAG: SIMPL domain-containing protein [Sphingobacteriaceae bacterium]|nr:SIMPL domain-containing protein [Sphingobacteriaceae bacterium]
MSGKSIFYSALVLTAGIIGAALIFTNTWKQNSQANQTIQVTGSAKRLLTSDQGVVRATLFVDRATQLAAFKSWQEQQPQLRIFLEEAGFAAKDIKLRPPFNYPIYNYNQNGERTSIQAYVYEMGIEVFSTDIQKIETLSLALSGLIEKGIQINAIQPEYYYSGLADLKIEIQAEAAKDAMERAERIAASTGRKLGPLTGARMGVLQITPPNTNIISDYGMNDASSIEKEITAVVSGTFLIK